MPTLDFKGKAFVHSHHLTVPFRELRLDAKKSLPSPGGKPSLEDNLIIHGDNLHALKALLPVYAGKVDCIYIDPPYNTGNEGWCYNDAVRSPLMREWLKKSANPVDKEDLERHDKWLCMMWPRLQLLRELLAEDGAIFVSIDDNEVHRLRGLLDEVFGLENFITQIVWQKKYTRSNDAEFFSDNHDHILLYAKDRERFSINLQPRTVEQIDDYTNPDADKRGPWKSTPLHAKSGTNTTEWNFKNGVRWKPPVGTFRRFSDETMEEMDKTNRIWFGEIGAVPQRKTFLSEVKDGVTPITVWLHQEVGHNHEAKDDLKRIGLGGSFDSPKPVRLIQRILEIATDKDSLILDSFAGSGTTAHAVLALNRKDGGNRKFILVETEDYADQLTAERVRRVIHGYKFEGTQREELLREPLNWTKLQKAAALVEKAESIEQFEGTRFDRVTKSVEDGALVVTGEKKVTEKTEGLGGSFTFCTLGDEMTMEKLLGSGLPTYEALAKYVFFTATGRTLTDLPPGSAGILPASAPDANTPARRQRSQAHGEDETGFVGETDLYRVHLLYRADKKWLAGNDAALNEALVARICEANTAKKRVLVFASAKFMSQRELTRLGVDFCQLPYTIHRILGE